MKSGLFAVMRKELARFFGDKRMVASILLPGILIYFVYSFMGQAMGSMFGVDEDFAPAAQVVELPDSLAEPLQSAGLTLTEVEADQEEAAREAITGQELDLLLVFPADFDQAMADYAPASGQPAPQVAVYYNSSSTQSQFAYTAVTELLDTYEAQLANKFDVNAGAERYDLTTEEDAAGAYFAMLLPMLLMIFLYSGCAAVAPESIAGEKERGTIATLLITPLRRRDLALGKICALSIIALLSGLSSTIGTLLSMPTLMQMEGGVGAAYTPVHYLALCLIILSTVLFIVACISLISAFAKTIKEAQTYVTPLMILAMVVGVTAMFGGGASPHLWAYFIPFYNSVQAMAGLFALELNWTHLLLTVGCNLAYTALGVWGLTRMFNSEKVMFQR